MSAYLLDTNHAAALITLSHPIRNRVFGNGEAGATFSITIPVIAETLYGIGMLPRATHNLVEWDRIRPCFTCFIPDEFDAVCAAELQRSLRRRGVQLETVDAFIAVVAIRYDQVLLTADNDFSFVPNLNHENWF
jgi:tRNA(fMet)-specific endonuclease VapC